MVARLQHGAQSSMSDKPAPRVLSLEHQGYTAEITIPAVWLGRHQKRYDEAYQAATDKGLSPLYTDFAVSMALLQDWDIEHMPANVDDWQIDEVPIQIMKQVSRAVIDDYLGAFVLPKN